MYITGIITGIVIVCFIAFIVVNIYNKGGKDKNGGAPNAAT